MRDAIRRDIEQALAALAFATTVHERLESQRRLFADFPRVTEQIRSGPLERVGSALARLYEGKEQFDLSRFLRDLPLALAQLAAAEAKRSVPPPVEKAATAGGDSSPPPAGGNGAGVATATVATEPGQPVEGEGAAQGGAQAGGEAAQPEAATPQSEAQAPESAQPPEAAQAPEAPPPSPPPGESAGPPSPRVELRTRMLAAVPQLGKAVLTYRRTVATVRRAAAPRRAPGPWRSDREVLEEAQRAIEFAQQMFDAYAEAWADQPVQPGIAESMSAEADRFLAWTQLSRYVELAGRGATQGSPGAGAQPSEGARHRVPEPSKPPEPANPAESSKPQDAAAASAEPSAPQAGTTQGSPGAGGAPATTEGNP